MDRTSASLSIFFAILGRSSETWIPATLVEIGLKLLLGLGSQVSMWLGPPSSQNRMTEVALPPAGALDVAARRYSLSVSPRNPRDPTLRKSRREPGWLAISFLLFYFSCQLS